MKIYEITNKNKTWNSLNNIDILSVRDTYNDIVRAAELAVKLKRLSMMLAIQQMIIELIDKIDKILKINYPDVDDQDVIDMKVELTQYRDSLLEIYQKIN